MRVMIWPFGGVILRRAFSFSSVKNLKLFIENVAHFGTPVSVICREQYHSRRNKDTTPTFAVGVFLLR